MEMARAVLRHNLNLGIILSKKWAIVEHYMAPRAAVLYYSGRQRNPHPKDEKENIFQLAIRICLS